MRRPCNSSLRQHTSKPCSGPQQDGVVRASSGERCAVKKMMSISDSVGCVCSVLARVGRDLAVEFRLALVLALIIPRVTAPLLGTLPGNPLGRRCVAPRGIGRAGYRARQHRGRAPGARAYCTPATRVCACAARRDSPACDCALCEHRVYRARLGFHGTHARWPLTLLVHVLDLEDAEHFIATIKERYERPLLEILKC